MKHGEGYLYPHDFPGHYVPQDYLPPALKGKLLYRPTTQGFEKQISDYLKVIRSGKSQDIMKQERKQGDD